MTVKDLLPVPDLEACRSLLCVQPHPDDNEVGAGATIAKLAAAGCAVSCLTVTDGRLGTPDPAMPPQEVVALRRGEVEAAARILGVSRCLFLDVPDGSFPDEAMLCRRIVAVIRELRPEIVLTCDPFLPYETHPDHRRVGMAVMEACLFSQFPHFVADPAGAHAPWAVSGVALHTTHAPNTFIDVTATWETKLQAIAAHASQFPAPVLAQYRAYFDFKGAEFAARGAGRRAARSDRAEAFKVLSPLHLHANVDTPDL